MVCHIGLSKGRDTHEITLHLITQFDIACGSYEYIASEYTNLTGKTLGIHKRQLYNSLQNATMFFVAAIRDKEFVGVGTISSVCSLESVYGKLHDVYVNCEHRGKGIATQMLFHLMRYAGGDSLQFVEMEVDTLSEDAVALCKKYNFDVEQKTLFVSKNTIYTQFKIPQDIHKPLSRRT